MNIIVSPREKLQLFYVNGDKEENGAASGARTHDLLNHNQAF